MKGNVLKHRKSLVLGMTLLVVAAAGTLLMTTDLWGAQQVPND